MGPTSPSSVPLYTFNHEACSMVGDEKIEDAIFGENADRAEVLCALS